MYTYIRLHYINLHYIYTYIYGIIEYVYNLFSSTVFSHFMAQAIQPTNLPTIDRISNQFCPSTCTFDTQLSRPRLPALRLRGAMALAHSGLGCPNVESPNNGLHLCLTKREPFGGYVLSLQFWKLSMGMYVLGTFEIWHDVSCWGGFKWRVIFQGTFFKGLLTLQ
jgi:hypothetical protein